MYKGFVLNGHAQELSKSEWIVNGSITFQGLFEGHVFGSPVATGATKEEALRKFYAQAEESVDRTARWANQSTPLGALVRFFLDRAARNESIVEVRVAPPEFAILCQQGELSSGPAFVDIDIFDQRLRVIVGGALPPKFAEADVDEPQPLGHSAIGRPKRAVVRIELWATSPAGAWTR